MSTFAVLRRPQFRRMFLSQSVSTLGDNIAPVAVAFAILGVHHSATELGLVLAARLAPLAVLSILGGVWADRLPRRPIMVASDLVRLLTQGGFALLLLLPDPALGAVLALQFVNGAATAFFRPAASGLVQEAVPPAERQSATALLSGSNNLSSIVGPAIAAGLIALVGNAAAVGVDALSFGLSALFLAGVVVPPRTPAPRLGLVREIGQGLGEVVRRRWVGIEILSACLFQLLPLAAFNVIGPLVADTAYAGAATWALVAGLAGAGALLGDLIALRIRPRRPLVVGNLVMFATIPLLVALAVHAPVLALVPCALLWGGALSITDTLWFTALQHHVPTELMSRVSSIDWMGSFVLRPVGLAVLPLIAAQAGVGPVLLGAAAVVLVFEVAVLSAPSIRGVRRYEEPSEDAADPT
jgi:predicted MFS family arabinose efflux permease